MPYFIYQLLSPSGKSYIGISKDVKARWASHRRKARIENKRHPLYDAIRSYGHEAFKITTLLEYDTEREATAAEIATISLLDATDRRYGYNISAGGEYDAQAGGKEFWARIRSDPEQYASYINNLSAGCKTRGGINVGALLAANRALPAKLRWQRAHRALRMARHAPPTGTGRDQTAPEKRQKMSELVRTAWVNSPPSHKKRHSMTTRKSALAQWARATPEIKTEIFSKISSTLKDKHMSDTEYHTQVAEQLVTARKNIDRSKQGPAASKGLKAYWAKLKSDPEAYAEAMLTRKNTLLRTIAEKTKCK